MPALQDLSSEEIALVSGGADKTPRQQDTHSNVEIDLPGAMAAGGAWAAEGTSMGGGWGGVMGFVTGTLINMVGPEANSVNAAGGPYAESHGGVGYATGVMAIN